MDRLTATALLDGLHHAQNAFYGGGDSDALRELLASEIRWVVPGQNALAGSYHGLDEVFDYFRRRRDLATGIAGEGDRIAALTDGTATIAGRERSWSTVGIYDVVDQARIAPVGCCHLTSESSTRSGEADRPRTPRNPAWLNVV